MFAIHPSRGLHEFNPSFRHRKESQRQGIACMVLHSASCSHLFGGCPNTFQSLSHGCYTRLGARDIKMDRTCPCLLVMHGFEDR